MTEQNQHAPRLHTIAPECPGSVLGDEYCFAQSIFDHLPDHVAILNHEGTIVAVNRAWNSFADTHGMPTGKGGIGSNYLTICRDAQGQESDGALQVAEGISRLLRDREGMFFCKYPCHDATENRWYQVRGSCLLRGQQTFLIISHQDITERCEMELALRDRSDFIDTLIATIPTPLFYKDYHGRYLGGNRAFSEFTGLDPDRFIGKTVYEIVSPELKPVADIYEARDRELLADGGTQTYECQVRRADGVLRDVIFNKAVFTNVAGKVAGLVGAILDISELKRKTAELEEHQTELELARSQAEAANRAKSEFLAVMSHELRTPLNTILGNGEILRDGFLGPLNPEQIRLLQTCDESGRHLLALINDILDLARIEAGTLSVNNESALLVDVCTVSLRFVRELAFKKKIQVISTLDQAPKHLQIDPLRLKQILVNLLSNAVKFTPEGGEVELSAAMVPGQKQVCLTVRDTGIGIAPEDRQKLFQPFSQVDSSLNRKYEGAGLGLAVTARLVELLEGTIAVESESGAGSRFMVTLPCREVAAAPAPPIPDAPVIPAVPGSAFLALVADDNQTNNEMVAGYLKLKGYRTLLAGSGVEALALAREHRPEIILMDIQMPEMSGIEAIREIRNFPAPDNATPIIAITALAMPGDRERCLEAGADEYLTKPVRLGDLSDTMARLLARHAGSEP